MSEVPCQSLLIEGTSVTHRLGRERESEMEMSLSYRYNNFSRPLRGLKVLSNGTPYNSSFSTEGARGRPLGQPLDCRRAPGELPLGPWWA